MILLSIMVSRYLLVSGAVGIAPINSHSNCTLLLLLAPPLYRWNRTITSRLLFVEMAVVLHLSFHSRVSLSFRYLSSCFDSQFRY